MKNETDTLREMIIDAVGEGSLVSEPAKFLAALMAGKDPRQKSSELYRLMKQINDDERQPNEDEWIEMKELVLYTDLYRPAPVSLDESAKAAKELMAYLHAKLRSTTVKGKIAHKHVVYKDLSPDEIEEFETWFTDQF